jgi:putative redox protein
MYDNYTYLLLLMQNKNMAYTSEVTYLGELRTEAVHLQSGNKIVTDAPKDNHGKGEAFSPTDLAATSLASCMLSVMGILALKESITKSDGAVAKVTKVMYAEPRRIGEIHISITMPANNFTEKEKKMYEHAAHTCPVAKSLHPDVKQVIEFVYPA